MFISADDEDAVRKTAEILEHEVHGLTVRKFKDKGHFCIGDLGTPEFPELLQTVLGE
jgi:hypothetical protein